jgi:hypothetical protein
MDQEIDGFDEETDDEAFENLKKRTEEKKKEMEEIKEEKNEDTKKVEVNKDPIKKEDDDELQDTKVDASHRNRETQTVNPVDSNAGFGNNDKGRVDSNAGFGDNNNNNDNYSDSGFSSMFTIGGGYGLSNQYHASNHFGLEYSIYKSSQDSLFKYGLTGGIGVVKLYEDYDAKPYLSVAFTGVYNLIDPNWGPFLRGDIGVMGWEYNNSDDYDDDYYDEYEDETTMEYVGLVIKGGAGFLLGGNNGGVSVQLLYTIHSTTAGTNDGVELQVGFHF